jgi:hypothetical protein
VVRVGALLAVAALAVWAAPTGAQARTPGRSCQVLNYTMPVLSPGLKHEFVTYRVYFANNGAVQMYSMVHSSQNAEADHTALLSIQKRYGLEFLNAPPLRIIDYKKKSATFAVPEKAVDSCGRITYFH